MFHKIMNLVLRFGGMGSKFILLILLSKFLSTESYGRLNLLTTSVTIMIYLIGLDFYNYSIRDILTKKKEQLSKLASTFLLYFVFYCLFFVILYLIKGFVEFLEDFFVLFFIVAITEHLSQELYRFQIAFKKITLANTLLFLRVFGYSSTIVLYYLLENHVDIDFILEVWAMFNIVVVIIALFDLFRHWNGKINFNHLWIQKGIKISFYFFIATVFLKLMEYSNRYIIAFFLSEYEVGIFSFYSNIAIIITVYVNTIVTSYQLPNLIENSNSEKVNLLLNKAHKDLYLQSFISFILSGVIMYFFLQWQGKVEFQSHQSLYYFLGLASIISNISLIYYFNLFINNQEKRIMTSTIKSGIVSIFISVIFIYYWGLIGAALGALLGAIILFAFRRYESKNLNLW